MEQEEHDCAGGQRVRKEKAVGPLCLWEKVVLQSLDCPRQDSGFYPQWGGVQLEEFELESRVVWLIYIIHNLALIAERQRQRVQLGWDVLNNQEIDDDINQGSGIEMMRRSQILFLKVETIR